MREQGKANTVTVKLLHNLALHHGHVHLYKPPFYPYAENDRLSAAIIFDSPCGPVERLLASIWDQLRVSGKPQTPWARAYRAGHNRPLNVGDVAVVGETAWAVDGVTDKPSGGWAPVTVQASQIWPFPKLFPRVVDGCEITMANWCKRCSYSHSSSAPCPED
jgi:hypothetical protein